MLPSKQTEEELDDPGSVEPSTSGYDDISKRTTEDDNTSNADYSELLKQPASGSPSLMSEFFEIGMIHIPFNIFLQYTLTLIYINRQCSSKDGKSKKQSKTHIGFQHAQIGPPLLCSCGSQRISKFAVHGFHSFQVGYSFQGRRSC